MKRVEEIRNPKSYHSFKRAVQFYVHEHNSIIPHTSLNGATPEEKIKGVSGFDYKSALIKLRQKGSIKSSGKKDRCKRCIQKFTKMKN